MKEELRIIKYSAMVTLTGNYVAKNGPDISDEDFMKLTKLVDKITDYYEAL